MWGNLDRSTVVQHIAQLSSLAILALDYRRLYGDQSTSSDEVQSSLLDLLLFLFMKFRTIMCDELYLYFEISVACRYCDSLSRY